MKCENYARNYWPLAKVIRVYPSPKDGIIRTVRLKKYLPYAINAVLKQKKYGKVANKNLTPKQIRELMGYFQTQKRKFSVDNLVPYELWKGEQAEPEDMDDGQVASVNRISVGMNDEKFKGSVGAYWHISKEMMENQCVPPIELSFQNSKVTGSASAFYAMGYKSVPKSQIAMFDELPTMPLVHEKELWTGSDEDCEPLTESELLSSWQDWLQDYLEEAQ
jgi:hypothetical protein